MTKKVKITLLQVTLGGQDADALPPVPVSAAKTTDANPSAGPKSMSASAPQQPGEKGSWWRLKNAWHGLVFGATAIEIIMFVHHCASVLLFSVPTA